MKKESIDKIDKTIEKLQLDFANAMADTSGSITQPYASIGNANSSEIDRLFQDPEANYDTIASYMNALYVKNGIISGTIKYLQSHPTFNHSIYAVMNAKSKYKMKNDLEEYVEAANYLAKYKIKYYAPYFFKQTLINGVSFFYQVEDANGVVYMEFPTSWGKVYQNENGVLRWMIDISKVSETSFLPQEIASAKEQKDSGSTDGEQWVDNKWYKLSNKGVAFAFDQNIMNSGVAVSEISSVIPDTVHIENAKKNVDVIDKLDTIRIIHSKVPTDKDGKPLMGSKTAKIYNRQLTRSLPKGVAAVTSPMNLENVPLNGSGNSKAYETVNKSQEQLFKTTGTPSNLFGESTTSSVIVGQSVQKDANWIYAKVLPVLENYYNYELAKYKTKSGLIWKIRMIRQSNFTMKDDIGILKDALANGGSRLDYLAATGMAPEEVVNKLIMEQNMLNIDSIMIPKQTSFTMTSENDTGRPETDDPTDDTIRIKDSK